MPWSLAARSSKSQCVVAAKGSPTTNKAVFSSTQALGVDWKTDKRPLTLTGGLPFFGGPGNNYSLHGIASMAERLRAAPGNFGLVLANGGWMTKEAVGVWSTTRPDTFKTVEPAAKPTEQVELDPEPSGGTVETYTVVHGREGPQHGVILGRTDEGKRFIAIADPVALDRLREEESPVGAGVTTRTKDEITHFSFA